jgi:hypothetical protein
VFGVFPYSSAEILAVTMNNKQTSENPTAFAVYSFLKRKSRHKKDMEDFILPYLFDFDYKFLR